MKALLAEAVFNCPCPPPVLPGLCPCVISSVVGTGQKVFLDLMLAHYILPLPSFKCIFVGIKVKDVGLMSWKFICDITIHFFLTDPLCCRRSAEL